MRDGKRMHESGKGLNPGTLRTDDHVCGGVANASVSQPSSRHLPNTSIVRRHKTQLCVFFPAVPCEKARPVGICVLF